MDGKPSLNLFGLFIFILTATQIFSDVNLEYSTVEETAAGTVVHNIAAELESRGLGTLAELTSSLTLLGQSPYFSLKSGNLTLRQSVDREAVCLGEDVCQLIVDLSLQLPGKPLELIKIAVNIADINDHLPRFPRKSTEVRIPEYAAVNSTFHLSPAFDQDAGSNSVQSYELRSEDDSKVFGLRHVPGVRGGPAQLLLTLKQALDHEVKDFYRFPIFAYDGGDPRHSGSMYVNITVTDANDNQPEFTEATYEESVFENEPAGAFVGQVQATDADSGGNGQVRYRFSDQTGDDIKSLFTINEETGVITTLRPLNYEDKRIKDKSYHIQVQANDAGLDSVPSYCTVIVHVKDRNDNSPVVSVTLIGTVAGGKLSEGTKQGEYIAHVTVSDQDSGPNGEITCEMRSEIFELEHRAPGEYMVKLFGSLDRETNEQETIPIVCSDKGTPQQTYEENFVFYVGDINDSRPKFTPQVYVTEMAENNKINDVVLTVTAEDADSSKNGELRYSFGLDKPQEFSIDATTGEVRALVNFNREKQAKYEFEVFATDGGSPALTGSAVVNVIVTDLNDNVPVFQGDLQYHILENGPEMSVVGTLNVTDADRDNNSKLTHRMKASSQHRDLFTVEATTGNIVCFSTLNREETSEYNITVVALDNGTPSQASEAVIRIIVDDENDNDPVIEWPANPQTTINITFHAGKGYLVGKVRAYDEDAGTNAQLRYNFIDSNEHHIFEIDGDNGDIRMARNMGADMIGRHHLEFLVSDKGEFPRTARGTLAVNIGVYHNETFTMDNVTSGKKTNTNLIIVVVVGTISAFLVILLIVCIIIVKRQQSFLVRRHKNLPERGSDEKRLCSSSNTSSEDDTCLKRTGSANHPYSSSDPSQKRKEVSFSSQVDRYSVQGTSSLGRYDPESSGYGSRDDPLSTHHLEVRIPEAHYPPESYYPGQHDNLAYVSETGRGRPQATVPPGLNTDHHFRALHTNQHLLGEQGGTSPPQSPAEDCSVGSDASGADSGKGASEEDINKLMLLRGYLICNQSGQYFLRPSTADGGVAPLHTSSSV